MIWVNSYTRSHSTRSSLRHLARASSSLCGSPKWTLRQLPLNCLIWSHTKVGGEKRYMEKKSFPAVMSLMYHSSRVLVNGDLISTRTVTRSFVDKYAHQLWDDPKLLMSFKTNGDFDKYWPQHGGRAPVMPTTLVLAGLKEGELSE